jgi:uncharacterized protein involved in outer membrane biogenesis
VDGSWGYIKCRKESGVLMKKIVIRLLIAVLVLIVLAVLAVSLFLDGAIKRGVETIGPRLTKVDIQLQSVKLSLLSGSGTIKGLVVGNPEGYKTASAIKIGTIGLALNPGSLLSDKIVVRSIQLEAPEITFETDFKGNNLKKIQANLNDATSGGAVESSKPAEPSPSAQALPPKEAKAANRKLEVDDLLITGGKVNVSITALQGQTATVPLPEIHLTNLGTGPDGITAAELAKEVIKAIEQGAAQSASGAVSGLGGQAGALTKGLGKGATNAVDSVTKGIGGLFKKN